MVDCIGRHFWPTFVMESRHVLLHGWKNPRYDFSNTRRLTTPIYKRGQLPFPPLILDLSIYLNQTCIHIYLTLNLSSFDILTSCLFGKTGPCILPPYTHVFL